VYTNTNTTCPEQHKDAYKILQRQYRLLKKHGVLTPADTCAKCATTAAKSGMPLQLHHIVPLRQPMPGLNHNHPSNLHTLCHQCHMVWHKCVEGLLSYNTWMTNQSVETDQRMLKAYKAKRAKKRSEAIAKHRTRAV
jgi:HNH endonuclease